MNIDALTKILEMDKVNTERLLKELVTEYSFVDFLLYGAATIQRLPTVRP